MNTHVQRDKLKLAHRPKHLRVPRWSHQRELENLKGKQVSLSGAGISGTLLEVDQFTVKVDSGGPKIVFKHAITSIHEVH